MSHGSAGRVERSIGTAGVGSTPSSLGSTVSAGESPRTGGCSVSSRGHGMAGEDRWAGRVGLLVATLIAAALPARAEVEPVAGSTLSIGVLSVEPEAFDAGYEALAATLGARTGQPLRFEPLDYDQLQSAVASRRVDALITNARHLGLLGDVVDAELAVLVHATPDGRALPGLAGVVVVRATSELRSLEGLADVSIGASDPRSLGGYQAQLHALDEEGITIDRSAIEFLGSDAAVLEAVQAGRVEAGFVRAGGLERRVASGRIAPGALRVLADRRQPGEPVARSTRRFEGPIVATLSHCGEEAARRLGSALLGLPPGDRAALRAGFFGFRPVPRRSESDARARALGLPGEHAAALADHLRLEWPFVVDALVALLLCIAFAILLGRRNARLARASLALAQVAARQDAILSAAPDTLIEIGEDRRIREIWAFQPGLFERTREALIGQRPEALFPQHAEALRRLVEDGFRDGEAHLPTTRFDGPRISKWYELPARRFDAGGGALRLLMAARDVTARVAREERLRLLEFAVDSADEAMLLIDGEARIRTASGGAERLFGRPRAELETLHLRDIDPGFPEARWPWHWQTLLAEGHRVFERRIDRVEGHARILEVRSHHVRFEGEDLELSISRDVTELRRAEEELVRERDRLRRVLDGTRAATWEWDLRTDDFRVNARWAEIVGLELADFEHLDAQARTALLHPDDAPRAETELRSHLDEESEVFEIEVRKRHRDGHWVWVLTRGSVVERDESGAAVRVAGIDLDITDRKSSEERLRILGRIVYDLSYEWDVATDSFEVFGDLSALLGLDPAPSVWRIEDWVALIHPDDRARIADELEGFRRAGERFDLHYRIHHASGTWRAVHERAVAVSGADGRPVRWIGAMSDVTERQRADAALRLAASVFEHAGEGIVITDADGTIVDVNAAFSRITGYEREDVVGRNPRLLKSGLHDRAFYATMWRQLAVDGRWSGDVWNRRKDGEVYAEHLTISAVRDGSGRARRFVGLFSDVTQQRRHERQLERVAHFDALTDLPNRVLLSDRLQRAMARAQRAEAILAAAYIDLDGFKEVNDAHGHPVGDQLLVTLAQRMRVALREGDTVARLGGDEFVAVIEGLSAPEDAVPAIERLLTAVSEPVRLGSRTMKVSASIGVSFFPQATPVDPDQLLRQADQAMYQAKLGGKRRYQLFDHDREEHVRAWHVGVEQVRSGLVAGQFVLHYQPKVHLRTGALIGLEALVRWQHPERGLLPPAAFLGLIEGSPVSMELDDWVLEAALAQMDRWGEAGREVSVSVNVGADQLQRSDLVERLRAQLQAHPRVAHRLELEVLETSALEDVARASEVMRACAELGVRFALDDFGTGYSSLSYLKSLPAAVLKIDRSFVRHMTTDPADLAILQGVIGLAAAFDREVIAEGVETEAHAQLLVRLGCDRGQGYGIARPMPADRVPEWIDAWRPPESWSRRRHADSGDLPIVHASVEHAAWSASLLAALGEPERAPPELDPHACRFGQWLDHAGPASLGGRSVSRLHDLHERIHALGAELLSTRPAPPEPTALADFEDCGRALLSALGAVLDERSGGEAPGPDRH